MKVSRYDYITQAAKKVHSSWTNVEKLKFHYFNPRGLVAKKRANDQLISGLVDAGTVPSGWHLAYGTFSDFSEKNLIELAMQKRVSRIKAEVAIRMLAEEVLKVSLKIVEAKNGEAA